jgi:uncharacterized protein (UPF0335 family)
MSNEEKQIKEERLKALVEKKKRIEQADEAVKREIREIIRELNGRL